jgi:hypothetical protein
MNIKKIGAVLASVILSGTLLLNKDALSKGVTFAFCPLIVGVSNSSTIVNTCGEKVPEVSNDFTVEIKNGVKSKG